MFFILKAIIVEAQFEFLADRVNNFSKIIYISSPDRQKQYAYSASRTNGKCIMYVKCSVFYTDDIFFTNYSIKFQRVNRSIHSFQYTTEIIIAYVFFVVPVNFISSSVTLTEIKSLTKSSFDIYCKIKNGKTCALSSLR